MNDAERAERMMREHLGVVPPWDRPWKLKAYELILSRIDAIRVFQGVGLTNGLDPERKRLIRQEIGDTSDQGPEDHGFNVWLLNECIGPRIMSGSNIFMRCLTCTKIRTGVGMAKGLCKCGSNRMSSAAGQMDTRRAMGYLVSGY